MTHKPLAMAANDLLIVARIGQESETVMHKMQAFYRDVQVTMDRMRAQTATIQNADLRATVTKILDGIQVNMAKPELKGH